MSTVMLAREISDFFLEYDMLGGATWQEMYDATLKVFEEKDIKGIKILTDYFKPIQNENFRAKTIYIQVLEFYLKKILKKI